MTERDEFLAAFAKRLRELRLLLASAVPIVLAGSLATRIFQHRAHSRSLTLVLR